MPLPQDVDVHDASMLMVYRHLFCQHQHNQQLRSHVLAVDILDWARTLFEQPGFQWSTLRVAACQEADSYVRA